MYFLSKLLLVLLAEKCLLQIIPKEVTTDFLLEEGTRFRRSPSPKYFKSTDKIWQIILTDLNVLRESIGLNILSRDKSVKLSSKILGPDRRFFTFLYSEATTISCVGVLIPVDNGRKAAISCKTDAEINPDTVLFKLEEINKEVREKIINITEKSQQFCSREDFMIKHTGMEFIIQHTDFMIQHTQQISRIPHTRKDFIIQHTQQISRILHTRKDFIIQHTRKELTIQNTGKRLIIQKQKTKKKKVRNQGILIMNMMSIT
uniref:Uncharacterized protein n=1 Tax=Ditylenchus dipsaci TaxID=166011 RepID=A0A915CWD2_9BILA